MRGEKRNYKERDPMEKRKGNISVERMNRLKRSPACIHGNMESPSSH